MCDDEVAVRYGRQGVSLQGASGVWKIHCKDPVVFSAWAGNIIEVETGLGRNNSEGNSYGIHECWNFRNVSEKFPKRRLRARVQLDGASRMFISEERINWMNHLECLSRKKVLVTRTSQRYPTGSVQSSVEPIKIYCANYLVPI